PNRPQQKAKSKVATGPGATFTPLPANAEATVSAEAERKFPRYPATGNESPEVRGLVRRVDAGALAVQRPHEWLRLLGAVGDPRDIGRFMGYIVERSKPWNESKNALAEAIGQS